jgi:hypothetical protein
MYSESSIFDLTGVYDDLMENLRVRYVISYRSTSSGSLDAARTVRVELVDPKTNGPLEIIDANGKVIRSTMILENSYVPNTDPAKAGRALITLIESPTPPAHLLLGPDAFEFVNKELDALRSEFGQWEAVTSSTNFDQ